MPLENDDILGEILIRLPAESVIRCRAVCKRWRAVIDEPPFVRAHQHQPINKSIIIIQPDPSASICYSLDLESLSFSNGHQTIAATPLDFSGASLWSVVGACKGLALTSKPLGIWNPLTQERLDLDLPTTGHAAADVFGLGYDYITDDYKAVSILSTKPRRTDVYILKLDSWRTITNCPRGPKGHGVFVCGALNWMSPKAGNNTEVYDAKIIALDLGTEKYTLLQTPRFRHHVVKVLDVLGGCLILCDIGLFGQLDVWVMKDYGDEGSWIKLLSIDQMGRCDGFLRPIGFIMMRLQVFLQAYRRDFFLFDVKTNSSKKVFVQGHDPSLYPQRMLPGTKFCLHDNCGGGGARRKTKTTSSTNKKPAERFVFCLKDVANDRRCDGSCSLESYSS